MQLSTGKDYFMNFIDRHPYSFLTAASAAIMLLMSMFILTACGDDSSGTYRQQRIYQQYALKYNASTDVLTASAVFRKSDRAGNTLTLESPSLVEFNGKGLEKKNGNYSIDIRGLPNELTFEWKDADGLSYVNSFELTALITSNLPNHISRDSDLFVSWDGQSLQPEYDEFARLTIKSDRNSQINSATTRTGNEVRIDDNDLRYLASGPGLITLMRESEMPLTQSTEVGGHCSLSWTVDQNVEID
jgi:hypothetical protein